MKKLKFISINDRLTLSKQQKPSTRKILVLFFLFHIAALSTVKSAAQPKATRKHSFKDFIEKYSPATVWDQIDQEKAKGANYTLEEETEKFNNAIDPTDELLKLKVPNGDAKILTQKNGRRWMPPYYSIRNNTHFSEAYQDAWNTRYRIVELMKQAIYQARNKMIIMQTLREEYRNQSSYKMGYLVAKTDFATKTLAAFAFRAMRACSTKRQLLTHPEKLEYRFLEILYTLEKQMHLWFEVDLLIDLYWTNHLIAQRATNKRKIINVKKWNERFVN